jgi:hypothetical protein
MANMDTQNNIWVSHLGCCLTNIFRLSNKYYLHSLCYYCRAVSKNYKEAEFVVLLETCVSFSVLTFQLLTHGEVLLAYFPKAGLCDLHVVCVFVSVYPLLTTFER